MKKQNQYYVYVYLDPRKSGTFTYGHYQFDYEPFYVGKGKDERLYDHFTIYGLKTDNNKHKVNKILKIKRDSDIWPIVIKYKDNILVEQKAFDLEIDMITKIGRADLHKGPLTNLTDGGEGPIGRIITWGDKISKAKTGIQKTKEWSVNHSIFMKNRFIGNKNSNWKYHYTFISPKGTKYKNVISLSNFCKEHKLNFSSVSGNMERKNNKLNYKKWIITRIKNDII
jgi:hypothetical protein